MNVNKDDMRMMILEWLDKMIQNRQEFIENYAFKVNGFEVGACIDLRDEKELHVNYKMFRLIEEYAGMDGVTVEPAPFSTNSVKSDGRKTVLFKHVFVYRCEWIIYALEDRTDD